MAMAFNDRNSPILSLPVEVLHLIIAYLEYAEDVNSLGRTCQSLRNIADQRLYPYFAQNYSPRSIRHLIASRNVDSLRKLLSIDLDFERYVGAFRDHQTPFEFAASQGFDDIIQVFIDSYGLDHMLCDTDHFMQALKAAVREGHTGVLKILLEWRKTLVEVPDCDDHCLGYVRIILYHNYIKLTWLFN